MKIIVDFSGGLDLVFSNQKELRLELPEGTTLGQLINILAKEHATKDKVDMFWANNKIRPGILVLVDEVDWELLEKEGSVLEHNNKVSFISTLHGG